MRHCCCAGGVRWLAEKCCDSSCLGTCPDSEDPCECAEGLTFCDAYRAAQGMPSPMDPTMCYWWFHNGCRYRVLGTDGAPCVAVPGTPHNAGNYGGATARLPNDPFCEDTCASVCSSNPEFHVPPAEWIPGCACGATKTIAVETNDAKCCGCSCTDACSFTCPGGSITLQLNRWPMGWDVQSTACTTASSDCVSCKSTGDPDITPEYLNFNTLIGNNNCSQDNPVDPCTGGNQVGCSVNGFASISMQGNPNAQFQFGFSVTRSCPQFDCDVAPTWFQGGPIGGYGFAICEAGNCCQFVSPNIGAGANARNLADTINRALGAGSGGCVTYTAQGEPGAWLDNSYACIADTDGTFPSTNPCHECLFEPSTWIGPFMSNCNTTATWLYAPTYTYQVSVQWNCANFRRTNQAGQCVCSGSDFGGVGGSWQSDPADPTEVVYGNGCPQFPIFEEVVVAPCLPLPTIN